MTATFVEYDGDGTTTDFIYSFPILRGAHVKVKVDGVVTPRTLPATGTVRIVPAPPAGTNNVRVYRETQKDPLVTWSDAGGAILGGDLNDAARQALYIAEEAVDAAVAALALIASIPAGPSGPPGNDGDGTGDMTKATYDPTNINASPFARANHTGTQPISSVTSLEASLNALTAGIATKADTEHEHGIADVDGLQEALDGKAASSHSHSTADISGLSTALAGKANVSHTHSTGDITGYAPGITTVVRNYTGSTGPWGNYINSIDVNVAGSTLTITVNRVAWPDPGSGGGGGS
jgi:hypothetical protein